MANFGVKNRGGRGFAADRELSAIYTELWELDENRLTPGKHYRINLQGGTKTYHHRDKAEDPLFSWVDEEVLQWPTYKTFIKLLDNYETGTGVAEVVTAEEEQENWAFINACMQTKVMKKAHQYLASKHKVSSSEHAFKIKLYELWFKLYRRTRETRVCDSSGFEHVFVGETRGDSEVIGFHNWIQFYLQEKAGHVDYQGYILGTKPEDGPKSHLLTIKFKWKEQVKPIGSSFIGTSPEFELALYTILYFCSSESHTDVTIAGQDVVLICFKMGRSALGTCHPMLPKD
jgi:poly(U)-specific endoribonuclease